MLKMRAYTSEQERRFVWHRFMDGSADTEVFSQLTLYLILNMVLSFHSFSFCYVL